jgi:hypothetical protein
MDKYGESIKGKPQRTVDLESGPDQRLRRISEIEIARRLRNRGRAGENHHGFIGGRVAPSEGHRGKKKFDLNHFLQPPMPPSLGACGP